MKSVENRALRFTVAIVDVYRDEDERELEAFEKLDFSEDLTEDFMAMLLALQLVCKKISNFDGDLIDFTHMLNKLAVQYVMEGTQNET